MKYPFFLPLLAGFMLIGCAKRPDDELKSIYAEQVFSPNAGCNYVYVTTD